MNPLDLRPSEIIRMFWNETIVIEEDAVFIDPEYFEIEEAL